MATVLEADALVEQAMTTTGLDTFDADTWREGLDVLLADYNASEHPEPLIERMRGGLVQSLADRLRVTDYLATRPDLLDRPVAAPLFVFGMPRTGTTLLSNLLACDPARRSALTWEIEAPVPPATSATLKTDPRALAKLEQERALLEARPEMGRYYRNSAVYPNECIFFMIHDMKGLALESRGKLKGYRDWLFQTDMRSAYTYHKRFLQLLQADAPGTWSLKMPSHALWLETLLETYPDARLVWAHRDPFTATSSFCSIISMAHRGYVGHVDHEWIGENCAYQAQLHLDRIMDTREHLGHERIVDVHYADLMREPMAVVRRLYADVGDTLTPEAETAMLAWLADNPQGKFGRHEYALDAYGLSVERLAPRFERYLAEYDVAREG